MGRPDFGGPRTPPVPHHLHDNGDAVDGDMDNILSLRFKLSLRLLIH